jgi:hypothetical protein
MQFVGMLMIYFLIKLHLPSSSGFIGYRYETESWRKFSQAHHSVLLFSTNVLINRSYIFYYLLPYVITGASQFHESAMFLLLIVGY